MLLKDTSALRGVKLAAELSRVEIPDFAPPPRGEFAFFQRRLVEAGTVREKLCSVKRILRLQRKLSWQGMYLRRFAYP
jgi:hypothetical protein